MYYYTIKIPRHENGDIAVYSANWFGVMSHCPKNVTVKIFNDKEGWLLAQVDDTYIPREAKVISEAEALSLMSKTKQADNVWVGETKIAERWATLEADRLQAIADEAEKLIDSAIEAVLNG